MSLQAKIEAVIYASEEPVTLPQLMGLLGGEAQAELDALDSQQGSLALEDEDRLDDPAGEAAGDQDALNAELLDNPELEAEPAGLRAEREEAASTEAASDTPQDDPREVEAEERGIGESVAAESAADTQVRESGPGAPGSIAEEPNSAVEASNPEAPAEKKQARDKERRLREYFRSLLDRLIAEYAGSDRGLEIREVAGGFRMATKPEYHDAVRGFVKSLKPPMKLSLQALETLAVIAYKQPVTAPEIGEIRGVDSGGVLGSLMARKLITTAGRKAVIGRPILYKTTKEFLLRFGLKDINELPSIEEFEKMAGELNDAVQEEIPMDEAASQRTSGELVSGDGSPALDELNTPPGSGDVAETAEDVISPRHAGVEGHHAEPGTTEGTPRSGVSQEAAAAVERSRDVHEAQADGVPEATGADTRAIDNHEPYTGNDQTGA